MKRKKRDKEANLSDKDSMEMNSRRNDAPIITDQKQPAATSSTVTAEEHQRKFEEAAERTSKKYAEALKKLAEYDKQ
jgi:hypothetical protein